MKLSKLFVTLLSLTIGIVSPIMAQQHGPADHHEMPASPNSHFNERNFDEKHREAMPRTATPEQERAIIQYVEGLSFDADKLKAIQLIVTLCPLPSETIGQLAECFAFDDKRVQVLKIAYPYCADPRHYRRAIEHLSFRSNQEEMYKWIDQH